MYKLSILTLLFTASVALACQTICYLLILQTTNVYLIVELTRKVRRNKTHRTLLQRYDEKVTTAFHYVVKSLAQFSVLMSAMK